MTSTRFWLLFCLAVLLAIFEFGTSGFAGVRKTRIEPKPKVITSTAVPKPVIKIGSASYVLIRIGKPYIYELRRPAGKK